ncbi:hypothetical protein PV433_27265 [Paenibacillus sp. GYB004]|uniref:hypothetical protein n=1 Tax=Paenibacillus sp. GYB004 TaxID=2994393 RepID=UPI002F96910B
MREDWTFQHQHDHSAPIPTPKYKDGDRVIWEGEEVTIHGTGRPSSSSSIAYDIKEYPHLFVWESEITGA